MNERTNLETTLKGVLESRAAAVHLNFDSAGKVVGRSRRIRRLVLASIASAMVVVIIGVVGVVRQTMESGAVQPAGGGKGAPSGQGPTGEPTEPEPTESPTPWPTSESFRATVVAEGLMSGQTWRLMLDPPRGGKRVCLPVFGLLQPYGWTGARCYPAGAWGDMSLHQAVYPGLPKLAPVWGFISTRVQSVTVELNRSDGPTTLHAEIFAMPRRVHCDIYLAFLPSWRAEGTVIARGKDGTLIDILRLCRLALRHDTYDECHVP